MDAIDLARNNGLPELNFVDANETGLSAVTADDFMTLLIAQLQYQDPTEPMSNDQILSQVSQMQSLQASVELTDTLEGLASGQDLASASSMIGLRISGRGADDGLIEGTVERASLKDGAAVVTVDGTDVSLDRIDWIGQPEQPEQPEQPAATP